MSVSSNARLLVFDDDRAICELMCKIARNTGIEAESAVSGMQFLARLAEWKPNIVVIDLVVPGMSGLDVIQSLSAADYKGKVILSSGLGGGPLQATSRLASESGLDVAGILPKPFKSNDLIELIKKAT